MKQLETDRNIELFCSILLTQNPKSYSLTICRLFNVMNLLKPTIYQILIVSLPVLPILQLPLLIAIELLFFMGKILPFIFGYHFIGKARLTAEILRFVFLEGFLVCCFVLCIQSGNEEVPLSDSLQRLTILLISLGMVFEYISFIITTIYLLSNKITKWVKGSEAEYKYVYYKPAQNPRSELNSDPQSEDEFAKPNTNNKVNPVDEKNERKWLEEQTPQSSSQGKIEDLEKKNQNETFWFNLEEDDLALPPPRQTELKKPCKEPLRIFVKQRTKFDEKREKSEKRYDFSESRESQSHFSPQKSTKSPKTTSIPKILTTFNSRQARTLKKPISRNRNSQESITPLKIAPNLQKGKNVILTSKGNLIPKKMDKRDENVFGTTPRHARQSSQRTLQKKLFWTDLNYY